MFGDRRRVDQDERRVSGLGMTFRWRTFGSALLLLTAVMAAAWSSGYPPFYLENDDVTIRMALEGVTVPEATPTGFALMTNAALGWAIVGVQRVLPSIPGWDLVLAATLLWALGVLLALVWDALGIGWLARATVVGALAVAMAPLVASVQFTISATLAGGAAALLALSEIGAVRPRKAVLGMAFLLFAIGLLIRPMGGPAGAVVVVGLSLPHLRIRKWWWAHTLGVLATVTVVFLAAQYVDVALYGRDPEWDAYFRFNWMVGPLLEWGADVSKNYADEIRHSVGWTANDWLMLVRSWGVDPVIYAFSRVSQAYQTQSAAVGRAGILSVMFARAAIYSGESLLNLVESSGLVAITGGLLMIAYATRRGVAEAVAVLLLFWTICVGLDVVFERLPWRLLGPLEVLFVATTLVTIGASRRAAQPLLAILSLGVMLAMTVPVLAAQGREARSRIGQSEGLGREVAELQRLSPSLVIFYGSRFPREYWWRPFHHPPVGPPAVALGWNNQNPQLQRFLTATGRQPLLRALCTDSSIFVVADRDPLDVVTTYMHEHFNAAIHWTQVYSGSFPAWRCSVIDGQSGSPLAAAQDAERGPSSRAQPETGK
jgi:hypothetical protein